MLQVFKELHAPSVHFFQKGRDKKFNSQVHNSSFLLLLLNSCILFKFNVAVNDNSEIFIVVTSQISLTLLNKETSLGAAIKK